MTVFLDTSGLYAIFDRDDANHVRAKTAWAERLRAGTLFLTNNYVLVETAALLQHRIGVAAVRALHEDVMPIIQVDWIPEDLHRGGRVVAFENAFYFDFAARHTTGAGSCA